MKPPALDLRPGEWEIVRDLLRRHVPGREVWAFGSRVKGTARPYSDLDLVLLGDQPLPLSTMADLADDFTESDLPFKVDLVDWATTSPRFRKVIEGERVVVQTASYPVSKVHIKKASSAESVGGFRFGQFSKRVIECHFHRFEGTKSVRPSGYHTNFVIEALDRAA